MKKIDKKSVLVSGQSCMDDCVRYRREGTVYSVSKVDKRDRCKPLYKCTTIGKYYDASWSINL